MSDSTLPKVLILGQTFTSTTGGGITLSSLFKGWPIEKLAIAVESKEALDFTRCSNYYRMGYKELKMPFPFNLFQRKTESGVVSKTIAVGAVEIAKTVGFKRKIKELLDTVLEHTGLYFFVYGKHQVSQELLDWIQEFNPDVIYFQPNSYKAFDFIQTLKQTTQAPLISHVMDDWFTFAIKPSPLFFYWKRKLKQKVKQLFSITKLHLSISDYMASEYKSRYGYQFYPYHNPMDNAFWGKFAKKNVAYKNPFKILYAGRVGYGVDKTLEKICDVVEQLGKDEVSLEIQTIDYEHSMFKNFSYQYVKVTKPIEYALLPEKFSQADALLIPYDFEGSGLKYIKYSMPTKVSEYMATGTPILVVGPEDTALLKYALQGWASVCTENSNERIRETILNLKNSDQLRKTISDKAKEFAIRNHDQQVTVNRFRDQIVNILNHAV